jgi:ureidoglycolate hydrolase
MSQLSNLQSSKRHIQLPVQPISGENFQRFGQLITPTEDGKPFDDDDAQLSLSDGIPRFYIMRLERRGLQFSLITRHHRCTQCLGSLEGKDWLLAVAPPCDEKCPAIADIKAFRIPGNCFVKLHTGTWHAGPYFEHDAVSFYNLELSDTNVVDHDTCNLSSSYGVEFMLSAG